MFGSSYDTSIRTVCGTEFVGGGHVLSASWLPICKKIDRRKNRIHLLQIRTTSLFSLNNGHCEIAVKGPMIVPLKHQCISAVLFYREARHISMPTFLAFWHVVVQVSVIVEAGMWPNVEARRTCESKKVAGNWSLSLKCLQYSDIILNELSNDLVKANFRYKKL